MILPVISPGVAATALICLIFSWNEFFLAVNLTSVNAATVPVYLVSFQTGEGQFWAHLCAAATLACLPVLLAGWAAQDKLVRGLSMGAAPSGRAAICVPRRSRCPTATRSRGGSIDEGRRHQRSRHEVEVTTVEDPTPGPRDVIVRVAACGICGTDLHILEGEFAPTLPVVPGHEFAGIVEAVGTEVTELAVGARVAVDPSLYCHECHYCRIGHNNL